MPPPVRSSFTAASSGAAPPYVARGAYPAMFHTESAPVERGEEQQRSERSEQTRSERSERAPILDRVSFFNPWAKVMNARVYLYGDEVKIIWCKCGRSESVISSSCAQRQGDAECKLKNNVIRAKSRVTELALCNPWEYFVTLTVADKSENGTEHDRTDLDDYVKSLGQWISHFNRKYGASLKYLLIPEEHKAGGWHMHGLLHDIPDDALVRNEHGYLDIPFYRARFGWVSLSAIRDKKRCARYITKYVTKTFLEVGSRSAELGKHLFYASHGLEGRSLCGEYDIAIPSDAYTNDYCYIKWYRKADTIVDVWGEVVNTAPAQ